MKIFLLSLLTLFFVSCAGMKLLDVSDFQKDSRENLASVEKGLGIIGADLAGLNSVLLKWSDATSKKQLAKLNQSHQNIQQNYVRTKEDFENAKFKGRDKVRGDDKDYEIVKRERDGFQTRFDTLDTQLRTYRNDRNALKDYLETKGIYRVDSKKINNDFIAALNESKKTQLRVKNELMDYNVRFNQTTYTPEKMKDQKSIIQEMVKVVEKIENETFRLQRQHSAFAEEIGNAVIFVTPGMKAHGYPNKIKLQGENVQKLVTEFETMAKKLE